MPYHYDHFSGYKYDVDRRISLRYYIEIGWELKEMYDHNFKERKSQCGHL